MIQKFYTDTLQSDLVKALVYNTYIPTLQTVQTGDFIVKGSAYIYHTYVIVCKITGILGESAEYEVVDPYTYGDKRGKYTQRLVSSAQYYDEQTHEALGSFLRAYRDCKKVDLMPFYNCFSARYTQSYRISDKKVISTSSTSQKCAMVPIRLNKKYTICIDCDSPVYIAPAFLNRGYLVTYSAADETVDLTTLICNAQYNSVRYVSNLSFTQPYLYELQLLPQREAELQLFKQYENYLYLLIQIPQSNDSSIVVLEGDHTNRTCIHQVNPEHSYNLPEHELNEKLMGPLLLMQFNCHQQIPYSPRLVEYLLRNVIDTQDKYWKDVFRVQEKLNFPHTYTQMEGVWDSQIRCALYYGMQKDPYVNHVDINGFVDKECEQWLFQGGAQ